MEYSDLSVRALRDLTGQRGLAAEGTKSELVARLEADDEVRRTLTGNRGADYTILLSSEGKTLRSWCGVNSYVAGLCTDPDLWRRKIIRDFGADIFGYLQPGETYREVYYRLLDAVSRPGWSVESVRLVIAARGGYIPLVEHILATETFAEDRAWAAAPGEVYDPIYTALFDALAADQGQVSDLLIKKYYARETPEWFEHLLRDAAHDCHPKSVKVLLDRGIDARRPDPQDALLRAVIGGCVAVVTLLLEYGASPNDLSTPDRDPFLAGVWHGTEMVQIFLDHGADVHAHNDAALKNAVDDGYAEVAQLLLDNGADPISAGVPVNPR